LKKILILMITAVLLCASVFALSSCFGGGSGDDDGGVHTHTMSEWKVEIEGSCTVDGKQVRKCTGEGCNHVETKIIPATGHTLTNHEGKEATCTEKGYKDYVTCSNCLYNTYTEIDALGHTYTTKGEGAICDICGETHVHLTWGEWYVVDGEEASCDGMGTEHRKCEGCNYVASQSTPKLDHNYDADGKCTECGNDSTVTELPDYEF